MDSPHETPLIIAHRGASALAPENTFAAFRRAVADGAEGLEFDVQLTRDGQVVVFHDETLDRTALRSGNIRELSAAELASIDIGSWFNTAVPDHADPLFSRETIPTLAAVLEFLKDFTGRIYIELKCSETDADELSKAVCDTICSSPLKPQMIVKSFTLSTIPIIRQLCPTVLTAALFSPKIMNIFRKEKYLVKIADDLGADELSLHYALATRKLMDSAENRGLPVTVWTVDNPRWLKRSVGLGLKAIITNDPARLLAIRSELLRNPDV